MAKAKPTYQELEKIIKEERVKLERLTGVFEELLVQYIPLSELRDFHRIRAGLPAKSANCPNTDT